MRAHCALYVDAGYLLASAATRVTGTSLRNGVVVDQGKLVESLIKQAEEVCGLPLLRVNWYDAGGRPGGQADHAQQALGMLPRVKLRLGRISLQGEQKGVDIRLGLDMTMHGRNGVAEVMFLVSGDDDLTEAVEEAQGHGVQVIIFAVPDQIGRPHAVSRHLQREADGLVLIDPATIDAAVRPPMPKPVRPEDDADPVAPEPVPHAVPAAVVTAGPPERGRDATPTPAILARPRSTPHPAAPATPAAVSRRSHWANGELAWSTSTGSTPSVGSHVGDFDEAERQLIDEVARSVIASWRVNATEPARQSLLRGRPFIPGDLDRALLMDLSAGLGIYDIDDHTRVQLRDRFWVIADMELG